MNRFDSKATEDTGWRDCVRTIRRGVNVSESDWNEHVAQILAERKDAETWVVTLSMSTLTVLRHG